MLLDNLATKWLNCNHDKETYRFGYLRFPPAFPGSPSYRGKAGRQIHPGGDALEDQVEGRIPYA